MNKMESLKIQRVDLEISWNSVSLGPKIWWFNGWTCSMPFYNQEWPWQKSIYRNKPPKKDYRKHLSLQCLFLSMRSRSSLAKAKYESLWNNKPVTLLSKTTFLNENNSWSFIKQFRREDFSVIVICITNASLKDLTFKLMKISTEKRKPINLGNVVIASFRF